MSFSSGKRKSASDAPQGCKKAARKSDPNASESPSDRVFSNKDLVALILENVHIKEIDEYEYFLVSRTFSAARNNKRLDQTRTGTIIFTTPIQNVPEATWHRWNRKVFVGNRIRLVAVFKKLVTGGVLWRGLSFRLLNVRHLVLERDPSFKLQSKQVEYAGISACNYMTEVTENIETLDIGSLAKTVRDLGLLNSPAVGPLSHVAVREFRCLAPDDDSHHFSMSHPEVFTNANRTNKLKEFHVDRFGVYFGEESPPIEAYCIERHEYNQEEWFQYLDPDGPDDYILLQEYPNLEHVTLGRAEYVDRYDCDFRKPLPQEALIKFVRHTPSLRWFRSNLSAENIAMLKEERPEVHFCN